MTPEDLLKAITAELPNASEPEVLAAFQDKLLKLPDAVRTDVLKQMVGHYHRSRSANPSQAPQR